MKYSEIDEEVKKSLKRDWIITNGIGGFCSQSALGCNTRKYHGLLIAPLTPPARRFLILSRSYVYLLSFLIFLNLLEVISLY